MLTKRGQIAREEKKRFENLITGHIRNLKAYREARVVALYYPVKGEVDLLHLMQDSGKVFVFPKVRGDDLAFHPAENLDDFVAGSFGIKEPPGEHAFPVHTIDLILIPALCFDDTGHRLGYGKGYYDRLLKANPHVLTVGVCFDECCMSRLPVEPWDVNVDCVVTQTGVRKINQCKA